RYLVITALIPTDLPGALRASASVFDDAGAVFSDTDFLLVQYMVFKEVERITDSNLRVPLIKVITKPNLVRNNPDGTHTDLPDYTQYYGLVGDDLALLRLEYDGVVIRNMFLSTS